MSADLVREASEAIKNYARTAPKIDPTEHWSVFFEDGYLAAATLREEEIEKLKEAIRHMTPASNWAWVGGPAVTAHRRDNHAEIVNRLPDHLHASIRSAHGLPTTQEPGRSVTK